MIDENRLDEFKKMLGKDGKAKVHVYFVHGLLTSFREFEAVNYMEYNLLADEVLNLKGILSMRLKNDIDMINYIQRNRDRFNLS
jgi:hypothetical protein